LSVTAAVQVTVLPDGLTTVPVNVVFALIASESTEPPIAGETAPTPWSILKVFGFVVVQVSVAWSPTFTDAGEAVSVQVGPPAPPPPPDGKLQVIPVWLVAEGL
jgi:hypothetical protein